MNVIISILIGAVAGWLAGVIMKSKSSAVLKNIILGIVGGFVGGWLLGILGFSTSGWIGSIITSTIGAVVLIFIGRLIFDKK